MFSASLWSIFSISLVIIQIIGARESLLPDEDAVVGICRGNVKGQIQFSRSNRTFYAFKGIPYAKPPVGKLRFKVSLMVSFYFLVNYKK